MYGTELHQRRPASADFLREFSAMNAIPAGYKQTEVGVIPIDWSPTFLSDACFLYNGRAYGLHEWERSGIPVIRLQNLTGGEDYYYSTLPLAERKYCDYGDLLYMWSATFGPRIWQGSKAIYHYHIWKVAPKETRANTAFLYYKMLEITDEKKARATNGGTMLHVTKASMEATRVALPPLPEQRAIAAALSDADALLAKLDQLIAKKRNLKQAAMQQLLTGQTRLPGFSGAWEVKRLKNILSEIGDGATPSTANPANFGGPIAWVVIDDIKDEIWTTQNTLTENGLKSCAAKLWSPGTLILSTGATIGEVGIAKVSTATKQGICGLVFDANSAVTVFMKYWFAYRKPLLLSKSQGSSIKEVRAPTLVQFPIELPTVSEQTAIATVLSDMDTELAALEARRDKTCALKQGMMQELLTGRIRLV